MAVGLDVGTMFIVAARKNKEGDTSVKAERNCFFTVGTEFEDMLISSDYRYIRDMENGEERLFICGKDALKIANLVQTNDIHGDRKSSLRRPMANMVINSKSEKRAVKMLKYLCQAIVGKPEYEGEIAVISIPSDPITGEFNNVFHSNICQSFIKELGYDVHILNEALSIVYATNPKTEDEDGETLNMTGIGISWGAGGTNGCLAYRGVDTIRFSVPRGGDWIDEQTASVCSLTSSEVTVRKEKASKEGLLNLVEPNYVDEVIGGLYIYYRNLIETVVRQFKEEFIKQGTQFTAPIEVVVSGGTSKPKGFEELVEQIIKEVSWPFEIKGVRKAKDPLSATALGCLTAAQSKEKKKAE